MEHHTTESILKALIDCEKLGAEIVTEKAKIVDMDRIRNKNREALGALRRPSKFMSQEEHIWMNMGGLLIRMEKDNVTKMIEKDQKYLDEEINKIRDQQKQKAVKLNELSGRPQLQGFDLQPLSKDEANIMRKAADTRI